MHGCTLLVGIGSPHGDDRAGWMVVECLLSAPPEGVQVRRADQPLELLDWLEGVDTLIVCDAMTGDLPPGGWQRWSWPAEEIAMRQFSGSHDFSLSAVLALAVELGRLPRRVEIWGIAIERAPSWGDVSEAVATAARQVAAHLRGALCHA